MKFELDILKWIYLDLYKQWLVHCNSNITNKEAKKFRRNVFSFYSFWFRHFSMDIQYCWNHRYRSPQLKLKVKINGQRVRLQKINKIIASPFRCDWKIGKSQFSYKMKDKNSIRHHLEVKTRIHTKSYIQHLHSIAPLQFVWLHE